MDKAIIKYIQTRLDTIQKKYNFSPDLGKEQVPEDNIEMREAYVKFKLLKDLANHFKLDVNVIYDPSGGKSYKNNKINRQQWVYFAQIQDTDLWKVGCSINPDNRIKAFQISTHGYYRVRDKIPGDKVLESQIKIYLKDFKTRDKNKPHGECFRLDNKKVKEVIKLFSGINKDDQEINGT